MAAFWITPGYCWSTPKCRNVCVPHTCFEAKNAGETSPRKSTPRTLKEVRQQYPPACSTPRWECSLARDSAKKLSPKMHGQFTGLTAVFVRHEGLREREPSASKAPSAVMVGS